MDSNSPDTANVVSKKKRQRSVAYPAYTLEACIAFASKIEDQFTSSVYASSEDISKVLQTSGGAFLTQLSSCSQYGILELKKGDGYKSTPQLKKIRTPLPTENVNDAKSECLNKPPLYKKLIAEFKDKQLPSEAGLANILDRNYDLHGVGTKIAAKVFLKNLATLKLIAPGNVLKFDNYIPFVEEEKQEEDEQETTVEDNPKVQILLAEKSVSNKPLVKTENKERKKIPVFLINNREAEVDLPIDFTEEDLKRVVKVLNAYLP